MLKYGTGRGFMKVSSRAGSRGGQGARAPGPPQGGPHQWPLVGGPR